MVSPPGQRQESLTEAQSVRRRPSPESPTPHGNAQTLTGQGRKANVITKQTLQKQNKQTNRTKAKQKMQLWLDISNNSCQEKGRSAG